MVNKKIAIIASVTCIAIVFWLSLVPWLRGGAKFGEIQAWLPPLLMLTILSGSMALAVLLLDQKRYWVLIAFLVSLPIYVMFGLHYIYAIYTGFAMLSILYTGHNMKRELNERYKIDMRVMTRAGMRYIMFPLLIGISFVYFFSPQVQERAHSNALPESFQRAIAGGIQEFIDRGAVTDPLVGRQLTPEAINGGFDRINEFFKPYLPYFPPLFSLALFIMLWSAIFLFDWLGTWVAVGIFALLRRNGFVIIEERDVKAEVIKF